MSTAIKSPSRWLKYLGILLLLIHLLEQIYGLYRLVFNHEEIDWFFWLSNLLPYFLAVAFIFQSRIYMTLSLIGSLVYESPWTIDFFGRLIFNKVFFGGVADYIFLLPLYFYIVNLNHIIFIPLAIFGSYKLGIDKNGHKLWIFWSVILLLMSYAFTSPVHNINCVHNPCIIGPTNFSSDHPLVYLVMWMFLPWLLVAIPLNWLLYNIYYRVKKPLSNRES